jgi:hypothetical protein
MKSYELQVLDKGNWLTDSVYDDRDLAVDQARQLDGNNRFGGIRVIEEIFTEGSSKSVCKTVFRDSGNRQESEDRIAKSKNEIRGRAPKPGGHKQVTRIPRKKTPRRAESSSAGLYWAIGILLIIALAGGGAYLFLQAPDLIPR